MIVPRYSGKDVKPNHGHANEPNHEHVCAFLNELKHSPENDALYGPISRDDPATIGLAEEIAKLGIQEPIMITSDDFASKPASRLMIMSGKKSATRLEAPTLDSNLRLITW
jgi:hypothetical protein